MSANAWSLICCALCGWILAPVVRRFFGRVSSKPRRRLSPAVRVGYVLELGRDRKVLAGTLNVEADLEGTTDWTVLGDVYLSLTPDQAEAIARDLLHEAAEVRRQIGTNLPPPPRGSEGRAAR